MKTLRGRLMLISLAFALLTSLTAAVCASGLSQHYLQSEQRRAAQANLDLLSTDLENDLSMISSLVGWIQTDVPQFQHCQPPPVSVLGQTEQ